MSETMILVIFALAFLAFILVVVALGICAYLYVGLIKEAIAEEISRKREERRIRRATLIEENRAKKLIDSLEFI